MAKSHMIISSFSETDFISLMLAFNWVHSPEFKFYFITYFRNILDINVTSKIAGSNCAHKLHHHRKSRELSTRRKRKKSTRYPFRQQNLPKVKKKSTCRICFSRFSLPSRLSFLRQFFQYSPHMGLVNMDSKTKSPPSISPVNYCKQFEEFFSFFI